MANKLDNEQIISKRFNKLTVVQEIEPFVYNYKYRCTVRRFLCKCDCGGSIIATISGLRSGDYQSCGCIRLSKYIERPVERSSRKRTRTPEFAAWRAMKQRCYNTNDKGYNNYGGRGIKVCDRWLHSFNNFLEDIGERPGVGYSLDRKDNNGNYDPDNCRWATNKEQTRNRRTNILFTCNNETKTIGEWSEITGIPYSTIAKRIKKGWNNDTILSPSDPHRKQFRK